MNIFKLSVSECLTSPPSLGKPRRDCYYVHALQTDVSKTRRIDAPGLNIEGQY